MSKPASSQSLRSPLTSREFRRRFLTLVLLTWNIPPVAGLGFILFTGILTPEQMTSILLTPAEPLYILGWVVFSSWYLPRYVRPVGQWLETNDAGLIPLVLERLRGFALRYWGTFLIYLIVAPVSVILSAEYYTDFVATPVTWFRVELISLIVSIIVGLPIFFLTMDLFGHALGGIALTQPSVTIKTKVFLIGALVPLLIDTMLVQYFWTRTGFFTTETFIIWLTLELLAIAGSLIFVRSFGQSLSPLRALIGTTHPETEVRPSDLKPSSTDEIGVLTGQYAHLLESLRQHGQNLEATVGERTAELARINRELEAFSYSVSHDLRAPLRAINGFSNALQEDYADRLDEVGREYLERVQRATLKMGELIDDLLILSRVSQAELRYVPVDLGAIAQEVISDLRRRDEQRQVTVDIAPLPPAHGDAGLLKIAITNLIENAWKYTGKTPHAHIRIDARQQNGRTVYCVRDNGVGFDPRFVDKLFGAFQRLHKDADFPGSGIGLATVQRIINRHGGTVWAEGDIEHGAAFYFTLGVGHHSRRGSAS